MLATKLNQAKANVLADIISRVQSDKANALDLVKIQLMVKPMTYYNFKIA